MRNMIKLAGISLITFSVTACSGNADAPEANEVSETRMDDVDVIDGTISDDMVDVDSQASEDPVPGADAEEDDDTVKEDEN